MAAEAPLFAKIEMDPKIVYAGQPFTLLLSLYTTGQDLDPGMRISGLPEALQLQPFQEMAPAAEAVNGRTYQVVRLKCDAICPTPGQLQFAPLIQGMTTRTIQNLIFTQRISTPFEASVEPVQLVVKPIPDKEAPPGFNGLIGSFHLTATCSTNRFLPGDLITLTFTVSGRGRFDLLPSFGMSDLAGFKTYPSRPQPAGSGTGTRSWAQVLVPVDPAVRVIPVSSWTVFNPELEAFETLTAGPFRLELDSDRPVNQTQSVYLEPEDAPEAESPDLPIHEAISEWLGDAENRIQAESYFLSGNKAYAGGRLTEAIDAYSKILVLGFRMPEVYANLGAACARAGQTGKGMLFLLRALRLDPRDAAARAHLQQILGRNPDLVKPALPPWSRLTRREWRRLAAVCLIFLVPLFFAPKSRWTRFLMPTLFILILSGTGGALWWSKGPPSHERVVTTPAHGHVAPSPKSAVTFRLPEGMLVLPLAERTDWTRVKAGDGTAWIPSAALEKP